MEGFGDGKNTPDTPLRLLPGASEEAESFLAGDPEVQARLARVAELIEGYETPFGMELLATVHWVARTNEEAGRSPDEAVRAVHAWNERKAASMKPAQIRTTWAHLRQRGWLGNATRPDIS